MHKCLIIQTAFIGDVVLATSVAEKLHKYFPTAHIDFLVRKGNESLLENNPCIHEVLVWNKKENKNRNLFTLLQKIRHNKYDKVINLQRYSSTGLLTVFSGAKETIGFDKNPLSFLFTQKIKHRSGTNETAHETERNNDTIKHFTDDIIFRPALYPSVEDEEVMKKYLQAPYITITPSSVWFTKKYPVEKWIDFMNKLNRSYKIYLLGGKENLFESEMIKSLCYNKNVDVLTGQLSFLQSALLMKSAVMNYTNDSAPMHFASAVNAPVTAIFCSTIPAFGYAPLSDKSFIVETKFPLACRPCSIHGRSACPLGHYKCAFTIETNQLIETLSY